MNEPVLMAGNSWVVMITALAVTGGLIAQIALQVLARMEAARVAAQAKADAERAALATEKVAGVLAENTTATTKKLDGITETTQKVHVLVNSAMGVQLRLAAVALRRVAELTGNAADVKAAEMAEEAHKSHEARQQVVDEGKAVVLAIQTPGASPGPPPPVK